MTTAATAQDFTVSTIPMIQIEIPKTLPVNNKDGVQIGTGTISGNKIYFRDLKGEFVGTIVNENNKKIIYDPNGKVVNRLPGFVE
jgi:hypothetical protein